MKHLISLVLAILLLAACATPTPQIVKETVIVQVTAPPLATHTPYPTYTAPAPLPTYTPYPTYTLPPTATHTPAPTSTPTPTNTPTPEPITEPVTHTGDGPSVVDVTWPPGEFAVLHITANAAGRHCAITSYDDAGNRVDLLVNTADPYDGKRSWNLINDATRLQVECTGPWTVQFLPIHRVFLQDIIIDVPGQLAGTGDCIVFTFGTPDTATITGNAAGRHFAVVAHSPQGRNLLVNTTDPYNGTSIVPAETLILDITATGEWTIDIKGK